MTRCIVAALLLAASTVLGGEVENSGIPGGIVVGLGVQSGRELAGLRASEAYLVQGLETDARRVARARDWLRSQGLYGPISVRPFDGKTLPYVDDLVNLVIADGRPPVAASEIMRVLAPGGKAIVGGRTTVKPFPPEIDDWTHYLYGPANNAVSKDTRVAQPRSIQWVAGPMWGRSHEQLASVSALVSEGGKVVYIEDLAPRVSIRYMADWKLTCRDAFNGSLLWRRDVGQWSDHLRHFRAGPLHLPRRLVAVDGKVYVTLAIDAPVSVLDAVTGRTIRTIRKTERTDEMLVADGVLYLVVGTSEINRRGAGDSFYERGEPKPTSYRLMRAIDLRSDDVLWERDFSGENYVLPLSMTVHNGGVYYQSVRGVGRLDAKTGKDVWLKPRETVAMRMSFSAPTVVASDDVLLVADRMVRKPQPARAKPPAEPDRKTGKKKGRSRKKGKSPVVPPAKDNVEWGVHGWNIAGVPRGNPCKLIAYSTSDGKVLWEIGVSEIYNSPVDVFVIGDTVFCSRGWSGYDLRTGQKRVTMAGSRPVAMSHHRCYRNKASVNYIFTGRDGIEVLDVKGQWKGNNSWIRGTCQYGIMPANGLLYTPQNACGCHSQVQLQGFFAAAPRRPGGTEPETRPVKGPAFGAIQDPGPQASAWPMHRATPERGGAVKTQIAGRLSKRWSAKLTGRPGTLTRSQLTQPVVAGGTVYVAVKDEHSVYALDAASGKRKWVYTTGGRIDSAPTFHRGAIFCGSADGTVHCVRADDGVPAWTFKAAPRDLLVSVYGQLESVWPVHGSILVHKGDLVFTAGRSTYLDDGLRFYRLDARTGKVLARSQVVHIDPKTDKQTGTERFRQRSTGFHMEGVSTDIMSSLGNSVYLKYMQFDRDGKEIPKTGDHLYAMTSMLAEEWFVRTYWFYGGKYGGGWGGWSYAGRYPSGRIMVIDEDGIFGYGRATIGGGPTGHKADVYHLYKHGGWGDKASPIVRAMVKAGDKIVVAGPVDLRRKSPRMLAYANEEEALASFAGKKGVVMRVVNAADGKVLSETALDAVPAFDGMSAADGKVFMGLKNGEVQCWE